MTGCVLIRRQSSTAASMRKISKVMQGQMESMSVKAKQVASPSTPMRVERLDQPCCRHASFYSRSLLPASLWQGVYSRNAPYPHSCPTSLPLHDTLG